MRRAIITSFILGSASLVGGCTDERIEPVCVEGCFDGLSAPVTLRRDEAGIVHVFAATDADVFYGSGYAQATDRLFQMDLTRRHALGRRAEVLGAGSVDDDALLRRIGIGRMGRENAELMQKTHPEAYALVVAWVAGVNARIDEVVNREAVMPHGFGELDYLPEHWSPSDALAVGKLVLFGNANQIEYEILATILRDFFPDITERFPLLAPLTPTFVLPDDARPLRGDASHTQSSHARRPLPADAKERFAAFARRMRDIRPGASNNWAVSGAHTESGRSLLAGDPHQGLRSPSLMWAHHMNSADAGGTLDVAGFSFVGSPTVQLGHNRHVAWTATTNYPDVMDLLAVPVTNGMANVGGELIGLELVEETIVVKGGDPVTVVTERVPGLGVLLPDDLSPIDLTSGDDRLLLTWPGFAPTNEGHAFLSFDLAGDLNDFEAAVEQMAIGNFNFVAATADDILYRSAPQVPARPWASDLKRPYALLDGTDPEIVWRGDTLPLDILPRSDGGNRGFIATANNDPFGFTSDSSIDGDAFYFGVFFDPGARAARIEAELTRLTARGGVTPQDMQALQTDTYSLIAELLIPELDAAFATVDTDPALADYRGRTDLQELAGLISTWDRRMQRDSAAALAFHAFMSFATKRTIADDLSLAFDAIAESNTLFVIKMAVLALTDRFEGAASFLQEGKAPILLAALDDTAAFLAERFAGADTAPVWSDYHATHFRSLWGEALDGGTHPTDGADGTVNVSAGRFFDGDVALEQHESDGGAIFRLVFAFDEDGTPSATVNYPRGNSGEPTSPYFANTLEDWIEGRYQPYLFRTAAIDSASNITAVLEP